MPKWITAIFVFFLSTTLLTAKAITVEDVIRKHVEVMATRGHSTRADMELLSEYARKGYQARLEGIEVVKDRPCYKICINLTTGNKFYYLIDARTWYLIRKSTSIVDKSLDIKVSEARKPSGSIHSRSRASFIPEAPDN